jgi:hypothetical protein
MLLIHTVSIMTPLWLGSVEWVRRGLNLILRLRRA